MGREDPRKCIKEVDLRLADLGEILKLDGWISAALCIAFFSGFGWENGLLHTLCVLLTEGDAHDRQIKSKGTTVFSFPQSEVTRVEVFCWLVCSYMEAMTFKRT